MSFTPTEQVSLGEQRHLIQPKCHLGGFLEEASDGSPAQALWVVLTVGFLATKQEQLRFQLTLWDCPQPQDKEILAGNFSPQMH